MSNLVESVKGKKKAEFAQTFFLFLVVISPYWISDFDMI